MRKGQKLYETQGDDVMEYTYLCKQRDSYHILIDKNAQPKRVYEKYLNGMKKGKEGRKVAYREAIKNAENQILYLKDELNF